MSTGTRRAAPTVAAGALAGLGFGLMLGFGWWAIEGEATAWLWFPVGCTIVGAVQGFRHYERLRAMDDLNADWEKVTGRNRFGRSK